MRLIDADALMWQFIKLSRDEWNKNVGTSYARAFEDAADMVDDAPTLDAVPVVRCKDCKHNSLNRVSGNALCELGMNLFHPYDFCSRAERSEDGET